LAFLFEKIYRSDALNCANYLHNSQVAGLLAAWVT